MINLYDFPQNPTIGMKPRYEIDGSPYISVTQILNLDEQKREAIRVWREEKFETIQESSLYTQRRAIIGTIVHWKIERWFCKEMNLPLPKSPGLFDDEGNRIDKSIITQGMKDAIDVIWSYFLDWAPPLVESGELDPILIEKKVWHKDYGYAGTFDFMGLYKGEMVLMDWKTSKAVGRHHTYGAQLTAYEKALLKMKTITKPFHKLYVVRLNERHDGVDLHPCVRDWPRFQKCLVQYRKLKADARL